MVGVYNLLTTHGDKPLSALINAIFAFHDNEHKTYIPFVIWWLDWYFFKSLGLLSQLCIFFCTAYIAHSCTIWANNSGWQRLTYTLWATLFLMTPWHFENLIWDKQIHVYISLALSISAISFSTKPHTGSTRKEMLWACAIALPALAGSFSFAYGVAVWPGLILYAFAIHGLSARLLVITLSAGFSVGYYALTYRVIDYHASVYETAFQPLVLIEYLLHFLGPHILLPKEMPLLERSVAVVTLLALAAGCYQAFWTRRHATRAHCFCLLVGLLAVSIGLLTAMGRSGLTSGVQSRYLIVTCLYYIALPGTLIALLSDVQVKTWMKASLPIGVCASLAFSWPSFAALLYRTADVREAVTAASLGTTPQLGGAYPDSLEYQQRIWPAYFAGHRKRNDLSHFGWMGKTVDELTQAGTISTSGECAGEVLIIHQSGEDPNIWYGKGWAMSLKPAFRFLIHKWLVVTDSSGAIVGFGTTGTLSPALSRWAADHEVLTDIGTSQPNLSRNTSAWSKMYAYLSEFSSSGVPFLDSNSLDDFAYRHADETRKWRHWALLTPSIMSGIHLNFAADSDSSVKFYLLDSGALCQFAVENDLSDASGERSSSASL